jgi:trans-aconitate methyltransferase
MTSNDRSHGTREAASARQSWNAEDYARNARFVSDLGAPLLDLLGPVDGQRILDLGCGDGALTERLVTAGATVVAIDSSESQVASACRRGLDARVVDARKMAFRDEFDAVFSNAVLHWISPPDLVAKRVAAALVGGGRFVGEFGGQGNVDTVRTALIATLDRYGIDGRAADPWYFPSADEYRSLLETHGFVVDRIGLIDRPTPIPGDIGDWIATLAGAFLAAAPGDLRPRIVDDVRRAVTPALRQSDGSWSVDYVRLRFSARLGADGG